MGHRVKIAMAGFAATTALAAATTGLFIFTGKDKASAEVPWAKVALCLGANVAVGTVVRASFSGFNEDNVWTNTRQVEVTTTGPAPCIEAREFKWKIGQSIDVRYDIRNARKGDFGCKIYDANPNYVTCDVP